MRRSRFKSIFVKTMAGVSVLLFLAITGLWVRSYWVEDYLGRNDGRGGGIQVVSAEGVVFAYDFTSRGYGTKGYFISSEWPLDTGSPRESQFYVDISSAGFYVRFPHWSATAVFGAIAILLVILPRRSCYGVGRCINCGYDLRATHERCPECGTVPSQTLVKNEPRTK